MSEEEITLEQAEDIVDNMYQNRFKECNVDNGNKVNIKNLDKITFNDLEKASILLLRTEISQKEQLNKYKQVIDKIKEMRKDLFEEDGQVFKIENETDVRRFYILKEIDKLLEKIE